jgi:hypothetical protein
MPSHLRPQNLADSVYEQVKGELFEFKLFQVTASRRRKSPNELGPAAHLSVRHSTACSKRAFWM